jgi:LacI family transcriptional regulator
MNNAANALLNDIAQRLKLPLETVVNSLEDSSHVPTNVRSKVYQELLKDSAGVFTAIVFKGSVANSSTITLVDDYIGNIIKTAADYANEHGYRMAYYTTNKILADVDYFERLIKRHINAGLISIIPTDTDIVQQVCEQNRVPYLFVEPPFEEINAPTICVANVEATLQAMRYLFSLGHKRIGFITGTLSTRAARERLEGYQRALKEAGLPLDPALIMEGDWSSEKATELTAQLLTLNPRPTAIVASNDISAFGAIAAIKMAHLNVPQDVSVIGFDDIPLAAEIDPPLTTVRQPLATLGEETMKMMIALLEGQKLPVRHVKYPAEFIERSSTAHA